MKELPIIFSAPMVRAILDGRKTQTRRILEPQPPQNARYSGIHFASHEPDTYFFNSSSGPCKVRQRFFGGDRLWVREAWRTEARFDPLPPRDVPQGAIVSYEADYNQEPNDGCRGRYRHARFMPRWASRITLEVTEVRVQRLDEISENDARAEGAEQEAAYTGRHDGAGNPEECGSYRLGFSMLWNSLHGPDAWAANPWVAAISFKRIT